MEIFISFLAVVVIVAILGRVMKISPKYDRKPRTLNDWNSLDKGIDPTDDRP